MIKCFYRDMNWLARHHDMRQKQNKPNHGVRIAMFGSNSVYHVRARHRDAFLRHEVCHQSTAVEPYTPDQVWLGQEPTRQQQPVATTRDRFVYRKKDWRFQVRKCVLSSVRLTS